MLIAGKLALAIMQVSRKMIFQVIIQFNGNSFVNVLALTSYNIHLHCVTQLRLPHDNVATNQIISPKWLC